MPIVGIYEELDPRSSFTQGSIRDVMSNVPLPDEERVAEYLDAGHDIIDYIEDVRDVIEGREILIAASAIKSDNTWIWRNDLAFYVRNYHLRLPESFLHHVRANDFIVPLMNVPELQKRTAEYHDRGQ